MEGMLSQDGEGGGGGGKKEQKAGMVCLLEQARWPLTCLEFPSEVIWFLASCQDLPSTLAEYRMPDGITPPGPRNQP